MVVGLGAVIAFTSIAMWINSEDWIKPVKDMMVKEELQTLDIRCYERASVVREIFDGYSKTLYMVQDYMRQLYDGELEIASTPQTPFSPRNFCQTHHAPGGANCFPEPTPTELDPKLGVGLKSLDHIVWFAPPGPGISPSSNKANSTNAPNGVFSTNSSAALEQEGRATLLDNVARVAYYSSHVTEIYWGFEKWEAYRQYPFVDLSSFANSRKCNDVLKTTVPHFTPLCRPWYTEARDGGGAVVFGKVDVDAVSGLAFLPLSAAVYAGAAGGGSTSTNGQLVGVAAVSANLKKVEELLRNTPLYESGMAYLFDANGIAVYHPLASTAARGVTPVAEIAAGDDTNFYQGYMANVVGQFGKKGTWVYPYRNPETDEDENW